MTGPAVPPGGEELREVTDADRAKAESLIAHAHSGWCDAYPGLDPRYPCHCRLAGIAYDIAAALAAERAAVLALPAVRDALAAQATLRRYANDPPPTSDQLRELVVRNRELEQALTRAEALAGNLRDLGDAVVFPAPRAANLIDAALAGES